MIFLSLVSFAGTLFVFRRLTILFLQLSHQLKKLRGTPIQDVSQVLKQLKSLKPFQQILVIVKGYLKAKKPLIDSNNIYSVIYPRVRTSNKLKEYVLRDSYPNILKKHYWRSPFKTSQLAFYLKDMADSASMIEVTNCLQESFSTAISQVCTTTIQRPFLFYNTIKKLLSGNYFLKKFFEMIPSGEQVTEYALKDGQYSLVIGLLDANGVFNKPMYVTKQLKFILDRLKEKKARVGVALVFTLALALWFLYLIIQILYKKWLKKQEELQDQEELTSAKEKDKCFCVICFDKVRSLIFQPCLHYICCNRCYKQIQNKKCPLCKKNIQSVISVKKV